MANEIAQRDPNRVTSIQGVSSVDDLSVITARMNPTTKRLLVDAVMSAGENVTTASESTKVTVGAVSTQVLASNEDRVSLILVNDSNEDIYVNFSGTAVMNEGIRLNLGGGSLENDNYLGAVTAICASGGMNVTVTEL